MKNLYDIRNKTSILYMFNIVYPLIKIIKVFQGN